MTKRHGISALSDLRNRNNATILSTKGRRDELHALKMLQFKNVEAANLSDLALDAGDVAFGAGYVRIDGLHTCIRLNKMNFFATEVTPTIVLPTGFLRDDNIIKIELTGYLFQNTGGSYTVTPRAYLGKSGSETLITSDTAVSIGSGARRSFVYRMTISQAPQLGPYTKCNEEFILERSTATNLDGFTRETRSFIIDITRLDEINSLFIRMANSAPATQFRVFSDTITIQLIDGLGTQQVSWLSQPTGANAHDATIRNDNPTTNYETDVEIRAGEHNAAAIIFRTLIRFDDIANLAAEHPDLRIVSAYLHLTVSLDLSSNARTLEAYRVVRNWNDSLTWNTTDGATGWGTAGCGNSSTDYDGSVVWGSVSLSATETVGNVKSISLNITELQKWIDGTNPNYGLLLKMQTETNDAYGFHSGESATPDLAPILEILYELPN